MPVLSAAEYERQGRECTARELAKLASFCRTADGRAAVSRTAHFRDELLPHERPHERGRRHTSWRASQVASACGSATATGSTARCWPWLKYFCRKA